MTALFSFYEVVEVKGGRPAIAKIVGQRGAVVGMAQCEDGRWTYSVHLLEVGRSWSLEERELVATGLKMERSDFYDGDSVQVKVNPQTGEGYISKE